MPRRVRNSRWRTVACIYHARGSCTRGENCSFRHDTDFDPVRSLNSLYSLYAIREATMDIACGNEIQPDFQDYDHSTLSIYSITLSKCFPGPASPARHANIAAI